MRDYGELPHSPDSENLAREFLAAMRKSRALIEHKE